MRFQAVRASLNANRLSGTHVVASILALVPLAEILLNAEDVTFMARAKSRWTTCGLALTACPRPRRASRRVAPTPRSSSPPRPLGRPRHLIQNFKLLDCLNLLGYFGLVKNLRPDLLLVCSDDLGLPHAARP